MTKDEALRLALEALEKLWNIIDDIDTYSDMAKADEKLYRSLVERRQRQRFEETGISTDGYELHGGAITAIKAALEANEFNPDWDTQAVLVEEIQRMAKRIEELEAKNEPAAWMYPDDLKRFETSETCAEAYSIEMVSPTQGETVPLYTTPPQRKPLTDDQILANETLRYHFGLNGGAGPVSKKGRAVIDAIEAAHGIKE